MVTSLFSIFDPTASLGLSWLLVLIAFISYAPSFLASSHAGSLNSALSGVVGLQIGPSLSSSTFYISWGAPLLLTLFLLNLSGLIPFTFTVTAHMVWALPLALLLWLSPLLVKSAQALPSLLSSLVPLGSPLALSPFMVLVESVSLLIRPITLSVRLMANMVAGHLLLSLAGSLCSAGGLLAGFGFLSEVVLGGLELAVAGIQAYVLVILTSLYTSE